MKFFTNTHNTVQMPSVGMGSTQFWSGDVHQAKDTMRTCIETYGSIIVDTAEMYGYGRCESVVGEILRDIPRNSVYLVGKILPDNVHHHTFEKHLDDTLRRLDVDYLDCYLLHWRENADLHILVEKMEEQKRKGKILNWGVSNFDIHDIHDLMKIKDGQNCRVNQIFYNVYTRGPEYDLFPYMEKYDVMPMSYSTLGSKYTDNTRVTKHPLIQKICAENQITPYAFMLAFNLYHKVSSLFSTKSISHMHENMKGMNFDIAPYIDEVEKIFPTPIRAEKLQKI